MNLTIELPPELERRLEQEAARHGKDAAAYARMVLERSLATGRVGVPAPTSEVARLSELFDGLPRRTPQDLVELARQQGVRPVDRFEDLLGDFWPKEESVDDFLEARRQWQWEGTAG